MGLQDSRRSQILIMNAYLLSWGSILNHGAVLDLDILLLVRSDLLMYLS
jgi:hypothetical protein